MNKTRLVVLLTIGIFFLSITTIAEEITLTTYYPAPYGEYQQLYVSGNVGIGTASPGSDKLRISSSDAASQLGIWPGGSADNRVWIGTRTANTNLQLGAGVSQAHITILSSGNVGIGTTGPQHELDVNESLRVMGSSVPGGGAGLISGAGLELLYDPLTWPAGTGVIDVIDRSTDGMKDISINAKNIRFGTGLTGDGLGLDRMYINSTGSVGIGTASPFGRATPSDYDSNLTVRGRIYILDNAKNLATAERLQLIHTRTSGSLLNNDELGTLEFFGNSASVATRGVYIVAQADGGTTPTSVPGRLSFVVQRSDGTMVNAVTIKNAGNVGIGTTGPVGKLQVALPNWTNRDNDSQHVIFGLGGDNKGIRFGYNSTSNYGVINVLDPLVAWGNLILQDGGGNVGIGTTNPGAYKLNVNGDFICNRIDTVAASQAHGIGHNFNFDIAEDILAEDCEPGDVVVIDPNNNGKVIRSTESFDTTVAGVISEDPAFRIGKQDKEGYKPLALAGRVRCKVTTRGGGPIKRGDLLVTSSKPGYAMRARPENVRIGTVLGKALEPLDKGDGKIMVLATLQ